MTDIPTPGQSVRKVAKLLDALPEPPTLRQLKEAEMERDTAFASAERNAVKVEQLRAQLKRAAEKASRERGKLALKLQAEIDGWRVRAESAEANLEKLREEIRKDAPLLSAVRAHAKKDEPTKGCSCPACQALQTVASLKEEVAQAKRKYRETKDALKSFQGPRSKKKGRKK